MSKEIDSSDVRHIGRLARLTIHAHEMGEYEDHLRKVLGYVDELSSVNTQDVCAFYSMTREYSELFQDKYFRKDKPIESLPVSEIMKNAPESKENQFQVDAVIEGDA